MSDKKFYTVPFVWSRTLWVMTFAVFILWICYSAWSLWQIYTSEVSISYLVSLITINIVMLPAVILCEGLAPQRLEIGERKLVILRRYKSITIEADRVLSVEALPKNALRGAVRVCGVSGMFGYFGNFYIKKIGAFKLFATNFDNLFLITLIGGNKIVISCSEPERMTHFKY